MITLKIGERNQEVFFGIEEVKNHKKNLMVFEKRRQVKSGHVGATGGVPYYGALGYAGAGGGVMIIANHSR